MASLNHKLQSATLIEVIISMILLMTCFSIAVMLFSSITQSKQPRKKLAASLIMDNMANKSFAEKDYSHTDTSFSDIKIEQKVEIPENKENAKLLIIQATDSRKKIILTKKYVIPPDK